VTVPGVLGLTRQDGLDYAAEGIRVNCVCPGWIKTNIVDSETWESDSVGLLTIMHDLALT
jgi:NAD(P)-dependent dehydrogenase (short-subunit alcohol dehydrogenase family)